MNNLLKLLFFLVISHQAFSQTQTFTVFKLENKIGIEVASTSSTNTDTTYNINITTNDRGYPLKLHAVLTLMRNAVRYTSSGNTSRFKTEQIDSLSAGRIKFPVSNNGSIKAKELLIKFWNTAGRPPGILSAFSSKLITLTVLGHERTIIPGVDLTVIELKGIGTNNELIWVTPEGHAIFMVTNDTESDRREVIDNAYIANFTLLNQRSNAFLINAYLLANKGLGNTHKDIAITGGNIIDVTTGNILPNNLMLINDGIITYIGKADKMLIPKNALVINATNQFLLPGLWNMHVHLFHPDNLKNELLSGVTTVRDMGNEFDLINSLKKHADTTGFMAPQIFSAGILDGKSASSLGVIQGSGNTEIKKYVKQYYDAGFKQIKVYDAVKKQNLLKIIEEASIHQMDVVGHIPFGITMKSALDAGMTGISHVHYFMNALRWNSKGTFADNNRDMLNLLSKNQVVVDPTLNIYTLAKDPKLAYYKRILKLLFDNGVTIVAGTDNEGTVADELQQYVSAGLTPLQALKTATIIPAQTFKMDSHIGSIAIGKKADIILLDNNPLLDINALKKIDIIIKGLVVIKPQ